MGVTLQLTLGVDAGMAPMPMIWGNRVLAAPLAVAAVLGWATRPRVAARTIREVAVAPMIRHVRE